MLFVKSLSRKEDAQIRKLLHNLKEVKLYEGAHIIWLSAQGKTNVGFRLFIEQLKGEYRGKKVILVIDNVSIHHANKVEELFDRGRDWLEVLWFSPYSPNLNLIERLWRHIKSVAN